MGCYTQEPDRAMRSCEKIPHSIYAGFGPGAGGGLARRGCGLAGEQFSPQKSWRARDEVFCIKHFHHELFRAKLEDMEQPNLLEIADQGEPAKPLVSVSMPEEAPALKFKLINRDEQVGMKGEVETMIGADEKARAIWELAGRVDLSRFAERVKTVRGEAGRAAWEPQLMVSLWVYAYSEGISSAREIGRMMEYEPGFRWLSGLQVVNHHTLSDFRVEHKAALDELFVELLGMLEEEGLLSLEEVMQDGTKMQAKASGDTRRR